MSQAIPPVFPGSLNAQNMWELLQGTDAPVILEIGAHNGDHTVRFLKLFPKARVYAFEPDARAIRKFKAQVSDPRAELFEMAIGATDGEADFYPSGGMPSDPRKRAIYPEGWDASGSLRPPKTHLIIWPYVKFETKITVPVRRLDSWVQEHGVDRIDFIWADVQGAEGDLIAGGSAALARTRYFYTEYSDLEEYEGQVTLAQILDLLPNFKILRRYKMDVLLANTALYDNAAVPSPRV
jgi:FkbM family methyltransferase